MPLADDTGPSGDPAILDINDDVEVIAWSSGVAKANSKIDAFGGMAGGTLASEATIDSMTKAYIGDGTMVTNASNVEVDATAINSATADAKVLSISVIQGLVRGTIAAATVKPTIQAYIGSNVTMTATGDVTVKAESTRAEGDATANSQGWGTVADVGSAYATVMAKPDVAGYIGDGSEITASGSVTVKAAALSEKDQAGNLTDFITGVELSKDSITFKSHGLVNGDIVVYAKGNQPIETPGRQGTLEDGREYNVITVNSNTIKLGAVFDAESADTSDLFDPGNGVDAKRDVIRFPSPHGFETGDAVIYDARGNVKISDQLNGTAPFYVRKIDDYTIKLFATNDKDLAEKDPYEFLPGAVSGNQIQILNHQFKAGDAVVYQAPDPIEFKSRSVDVKLNSDWTLPEDPNDQTANNIYLGADINGDGKADKGHGLNDGEKVIYLTDGQAIGGLEHGKPYYVIVTDDYQLQLANTSGGNALPLTQVKDTDSGNNARHLLVREAIQGLEDGVIYYARDVTSNSFKLAETKVAPAISLDGSTIKSSGHQIGLAGIELKISTGTHELSIDLDHWHGTTNGDRLLGPGGISMRRNSAAPGDGLSKANAKGGSGGGLAVAAPTSEVTAKPVVKSYIAAKKIEAGEDVTISSRSVLNASSYTGNGAGGVIPAGVVDSKVDFTNSNIAFVGQDNSNVANIIGDTGSAQILADGIEIIAGNKFELSADSSITVDVDGISDVYGGIAVVDTDAIANVVNRTNAVVGRNARIDARTAEIAAQVPEINADANAHARIRFGITGWSRANADVDIKSYVNVLLEGDASSHTSVKGREGVDIRSLHQPMTLKASSTPSYFLIGLQFTDADKTSSLSTGVDSDRDVTVTAGPRPSSSSNRFSLYVEAKNSASGHAPNINWDSTAVILSGPSPELVINAAGDIVKAVNISVNGGLTSGNVGSGNISVDNISNSERGKFVFISVDGTISGSGAVFDWRDTLEAVSITNESPADLVINDMDLSYRGGWGTGYLVPSSGTSIDYTTKYSEAPTVIDIQNLGASDIHLITDIANSIGKTHIRNDAGNIVSSNAEIHTNKLDLKAPGGSIGSAANRMVVKLLQSDSDPEHLVANAGGDVYLSLIHEHMRTSAPSDTTANIDAITAGGDADILLSGALAGGSFNFFKPPEIPGASPTEGGITAGGNVTISAGNTLQSPVKLKALTDILGSGRIDVYAEDNASLTSVDLTEKAGDLRVGQIACPDGNIKLATLSGGIVDAAGDTDADLISDHSIDLKAEGGGIGAVGNHLELSSSNLVAEAAGHVFITGVNGDLNVESVDTVSLSTSGGHDVTIRTLNVGDDVVAKKILAGDRTIKIKSAGAIMRPFPHDCTLFASALDLDAVSGIGTYARGINTVANTIAANTDSGDISLENKLKGTLPDGTTLDLGAEVKGTSLTARTGNVYLFQHGAGNVALDNVTAADRILVEAYGTIAELEDDSDVDLTAPNIVLQAYSGIGSIDTAAAKIWPETHYGNIDIDNTLSAPVAVSVFRGAMSDIAFRQHSGGSLNLEVRDSHGGNITVDSNSDVTLNVAGVITLADVTADALKVLSNGAMSLNTQVTRLYAHARLPGFIDINEVDAIEAIYLLADDGSITLTAGGDISAHSIISRTGGITLSSTDNIHVTRTVKAADSIDVDAGDTLTVSAQSRVEAPVGTIALKAANRVDVDSFTQGPVGSEYTTIDVNVDQIGWYDPDAKIEYASGDPGMPQVVFYNEAAGGFVLDYSNSTLKKLYEVTYKPGSGRVHNERYGNQRVIVRQTPVLMDLVLKGLIPSADVSPSPYPDHVYMTKSYFDANSGVLEEYEYVPAWSTQNNWEYIHASEFMGSAYDAAGQPDYWVRIQVGGKDEIEKSVSIGQEAYDYEVIGDTRLITEVIFHQIGWWWTGWEEGAAPDAYVKDVIKQGFIWSDSWTPAGKDYATLRLSDFMDLREQLVNPDDTRSQYFQTGVEKPGPGWERWYVYECVSGERENRIDDDEDGLHDDRVYNYIDDPDWLLSSSLETQKIMGQYVLVPVSGEGAYDDLDLTASGNTGDLYGYNWYDSDNDVFQQLAEKDYDPEDDTATRRIPVDHSQVTHIRPDTVVVPPANQHPGREYLGAWREVANYGTPNPFWTDWYIYDIGLRYWTGSWYDLSGDGDRDFKCIGVQTINAILYFQSRYRFQQYTAAYWHWGDPVQFQSTWDHVAWNPDNMVRQWDQVAVDYHWQYRGHQVDKGTVKWSPDPNRRWNENPNLKPSDYKDKWQSNVVWTNGGTTQADKPDDFPDQNGWVPPNIDSNSNYYRVDEFEDRHHYAYDLNYQPHDILDSREHLKYEVVGKTRPLFENPSVFASSLQVTAGSGIQLCTEVDEITAEVTGPGDVTIRETDAVTLTDVTTPDGAITVRTDNDDIVIDRVNAGGTSGVVHLTAKNASISEVALPDADVDIVATYCFYNAHSFDPNLEMGPSNVIPLNDDSLTADEDVPLPVAAPGLLANDDPIQLTLAGVDTSGTIGRVVSFTPDGGFTYDPDGQFEHLDQGETATDSFTYRVTIGSVTVDGATVTVTVNGADEGLELGGSINDGPIAGAVVTALVDGQVLAGPVFSGPNGEYFLVVDTDALPDDARLVIEAKKVLEGIRLMSVTPTIAELEALAGTGGTLSYDQVSELIVSNITTAAMALMDANGDVTVDEVEKAAFDSLMAADPVSVKQAIRGMAAAIKVVVDDPSVDMQSVIQMVLLDPLVPLPADFDDVVDLIRNDAVLALFKLTFPAANQVADQAMHQDPVLADQFGTWVNNLPTAYGVVIETPEDQPMTADVVAVDVDGDPLEMAIVNGPVNGSLALNPDASFTYTPGPDFYGQDSFTYFVSDGIGPSNEADVTIAVTPVNDPPVLAAIGNQSVGEGGTLMFTATASDPDLPNDALGFSLGSDVPPGAGIDPLSGLFTWTLANVPGPGTHAVTVRVTDGVSLYDEETLTIIVNNAAPTATDDTAMTDEETAFNATALALANDVDAGGDVLSITGLDTLETIGLVTLSLAGALTYDPDGEFEFLAVGETATDSFVYIIDDGDGGQDTATVVVTITGVNDAPVALADSYEVNENSTLTVSPADGLLANDIDVDQDVLTAAIADQPARGSLMLNDDGSFSYTPALDFVGTDTFTYTAGDGIAVSDTATVTITVHRAIELTGVVTDGPIADAVVVALVNGEVAGGPVTTEQNGEFTLKIRPDQLPGDARLVIQAIKADQGIKLMSLLPTISELDLISGTGDVLSYLEKSELKLSNITSAVFTAMDTNEDGTVDEAEKAVFDLLLADSQVDIKQAIRGMAAAIKVVVDDPYVSMGTVNFMAAVLANPLAEFGDVMDLVRSDALLALFVEAFNLEIADAVAAMRQDPLLADQFGMWANNPPVLEPVDDQVVTEGTVLNFTAMAADPDLPEDTLTFSLEGDVPIGAFIDPVTGEFSWMPAEIQGPWTYDLTVQVSDPGLPEARLSDTVSFTITVLEDANMDTGPLAGNGEADTYRLRVKDSTIEALLNDTVVFATALDGAPALTISGSGDNDTLIVDLSSGIPIPAGGIYFNGGGPGDFDTMVVTGGSAGTVIHTFTDAGSGSMHVDGSVITYTGLEPILDEINATDRVFSFGDSADTVFIGDDAMPNDNYSRISSEGSGETVDFRNPTGSLTINTGGGNDTVRIEQFDSGPGGVAVNFGVVVNGQAGDLQIDSLNAGSERAVTLTSDGGIFGTGRIIASDLTVTAAGDVELHTTVERLAVSLVGAGDLFIAENDGIALQSVETTEGAITVDAGGSITATAVVSQTDTDANDISLTANSGDIEVGNISAGTVGDVTLTAAGAVRAAVTADNLVVNAGDSIVLETDVSILDATSDAGLMITEADAVSMTTDVASLGLKTLAAGDVAVAEANDLVLEDIQVEDGMLSIRGANLTVEGEVSANTVVLEATGEVSRTGSLVSARTLDVTAVSGITLDTAVDVVIAQATGVGTIEITEVDAVNMEGISTFDGSITVKAGGDITATLINCITDADANDITLTTTGSHIQATEINAGSQGDVILTSTGPLTATVTADELTATAAGDMTLYTTVAALNAETTSAGDITVTETDDIALNNVRAYDGSITVTAVGTISALKVESVTDAVGNDINLTTTIGDVLIDSIAVGRKYGGITIHSAADIRETDLTDAEVDVAGHHAFMVAAGEFGSTADPELNLEMDLTVFSFYGEDFIYDFTGDIELNVFASGIVRVTATGTITVSHVESGADAIELNATGGNVVIGYLDAGAEAGVVSLTAAGSILEMAPYDEQVDLVANAAHLVAGTNIWGGSAENPYLETQVAALAAEVGSSSIYLNEVDDIELVSVRAPDGEIVIIAGGDITISGPVSTGTMAGNIRLEAAGEVYMTGSDPATTSLLGAVAQTGIFLRTRVASLDARVEGGGILEIRETDGIVLRDVTNAAGPVRVIAGGEITAVRVQCLADARGNNVGLMTLDGDILVDYIGVGSGNGQVSLSSAEDIWEAADDDPDVDLAGALGVLYAKGKIDKGLDRSFKLLDPPGKKKHHCKKGHHGQKDALYEFERGRKLKLKDVPGDVELFFSLENEVEVSATGDVHVVYLDSSGHDIDLKSKSGDIRADHLETGPDRDDVELKAAGSVHLSGQLYSGDSGQISAGDDIAIFAGDDVRIFGSISAGSDSAAPKSKHCWWNKKSSDITIDSGSEIFIYGAIRSQDDVQIWADDGVFIDAAITALDDIEIGTCGDLTTTDFAPLSAGDNIEIYAGGTVSLGAEVTAGDDIRIESWVGEILIAGSISAADAIDVDTDENLVIASDMTAGSDLNLHAGHSLTTTTNAMLSAGMDVEIETRWGDITLHGTVKSGNGQTCSPDVLIDAGAELYLFAAINSLDDVEIWADDGVFIAAAIAVADEMEIGTYGALTTTTSGSLAAGGDADLYAKQGITIGAPVNGGDDIWIKSDDSNVMIRAELTSGDRIDINADEDLSVHSLLMAGSDLDLYAGQLLVISSEASLIAAVDVELESRNGDIIIMGTIKSGNGQTYSADVLIDSGGGLEIYAAITSLDDVEFWADDGIYIDAPIAAADNIEFGTCGELTTSGNGALTAGSDIELYAKKEIIISAAVAAGDEVNINAGDSDVLINGAVTAGDWIDVDAGGDLVISAAMTAGENIWIRSGDSNVLVAGTITAGDDIDVYADGDLNIFAAMEAGGDLDLYARHELITANPAATLTAGVDVEVETRYGDIMLWGAVSAGNGFTTSSSKHCKGHKESPDVLIDSGSELHIHAAVNSLDDVEIRADDGIFIDAAVTAVDDIEIGTYGDLTTSCDAPLSAGDDIELWAAGQVTLAAALVAGDDVGIYTRSDLRIFGNIRAGDDVGVYARCDIEVSADIEVWDRIYLSTRDNITLLAGSSLGGINGEKARKIYLRAGDEMVLNGSINAEKLYIC